MRKKALLAIIVGIFVFGLIAPRGVLAQVNSPQDCCILKVDITWTSGKIDDVDCTKDPTPETCKLKAKKSIGPKDTTVCPTAANPQALVNHYSDQWGMVCLFATIANVINWIFYILMAIVVLLIIVGGVTYMTAAGDPEKAGKGKKIIIYAIVGLAIALVAKIVPSVVRVVMGL